MNDLIWNTGWIIVLCIALYFGNRRKIKYDIESTVNHEPTVIDLTEFRESMNTKSPIRTKEDQEFMDRIIRTALDETDPIFGWDSPKGKAFTDHVSKETEKYSMDEYLNRLDETIDWKNTETENYDGTKFNPFLEDEIGQFDPRGGDWRLRNGPGSVGDGTTHTVFLAKQQPAEHVILDPEGRIDKAWTEFIAQNPELFHSIQDEAGHFPVDTTSRDGLKFNAKDCLKYKTVITGEVFNGTLLTEGPDGSVLHYYLRDSIPPNGRYTVHGTVENRNIIHVTKFERHD